MSHHNHHDPSSVMKVDTAAILNAVKDIEVRLTEAVRQDKIPPWAQAFQSRLQHIEEHHLYLHRALSGNEPTHDVSKMPNPTGSPSPSARSTNIHDFSNEERVISRIRYDVDSQILTTKSTLEAQLNALTMEVDRLHKSISVRPTISEMQQVALSVTEVGRKINLVADDVATTVRVTVREKVAEDMESIMESVKSHNLINEGGINNLLKKVEYSQRDMQDMRDAVESGLQALQFGVDSVTSKHGEVEDIVFKLRDEVGVVKEKTESSIEELKSSTESTRSSLQDLQEKALSQIEKLDTEFNDNRSQIERSLHMAESKAEQALGQVSKANSAIADLKTLHECDIEGLVEKTQTMKESIDGLIVQHAETEKFVMSIHEINGIAMILDHETRLKDTGDKFISLGTDIADANKRIDSLFDGISAIEEGTLFTGKAINEQSGRLDKALEELRKSNARITVLESLLENAHDKIEHLLGLREEVAVVTELAKDEAIKIKAAQVQIKQLLESSEDHDSRIEGLVSGMERVDDEHQKALEDIKSQLTDVMAEKQAVVDAAIQNIREHIEAISVAEEANRRNAAATSKKGKGGGARDGGGGGIGVMSNPISGGASAVSDEDDRGHPPTPMTNEERIKAATYYAKFLSDLCISFEEISIRKTFVPELPPTMCEHITSTAQALTAMIATWTDAEIIQKMLRDPQPGETEYEEEMVRNRRQEKLDSFLQDIVTAVVANNPQPGIIRLEAREKFLRQLRKALNMGMSKHDQVLIVGSSRFGRVKIPSCIACDRPLLDKVRSSDTISRADDGLSRAGPGGGGSIAGSLETFEGEGSVYSKHSQKSAGQRINRAGGGVPSIPSKNVTSQLRALRLPGAGREQLSSPGGSIVGGNSLMSASAGSEAYVLKGGFKMPRSGTSLNGGGSVASSLG